MRKQRIKMEMKILAVSEKVKQRAKKTMQYTVSNSQGLGVIEVILILVVIIGLILIFKSQLTELINTIFEKITSESSGV